jgi:hypothetical protein
MKYTTLNSLHSALKVVRKGSLSIVILYFISSQASFIQFHFVFLQKKSVFSMFVCATQICLPLVPIQFYSINH